MNRRLRTLAAAAFLSAACVVLQAQATQPTDGSELDNLFTDTGNSSQAPTDGNSGAAQPATPQAPSAPAVRSDDLTRDDRMHYLASLNIYGLFGSGWPELPVANDVPAGLGVEGSGSLSASLGVDLRPAPELRLRGTVSYNFPMRVPS